MGMWQLKQKGVADVRWIHSHDNPISRRGRPATHMPLFRHIVVLPLPPSLDAIPFLIRTFVLKFSLFVRAIDKPSRSIELIDIQWDDSSTMSLLHHMDVVEAYSLTTRRPEIIYALGSRGTSAP